MRPQPIAAESLRIPASARPTRSRQPRHAGLLALGSVLIVVLAVRCAHAQTLDVLYNFAGGSDGASPLAPVIAVKGKLYGTSSLGGITTLCPKLNTHGCGTVFQLTPPAMQGGSWTESVIYRFKGGDTDGADPQEALIADRAGNLYGTTFAGGLQSCSGGCGTIFELQPPSLPGGAWTETVLYFFKGVPSGNGFGDLASPTGLVFDKAENLFGEAYGGGYCKTDETGTFCYGGVYKLTAPASSGDPWTEHILYRFQDPDWGYGTPVFDQAGNLYGTGGWGAYGFGMIFTLQRSITNRGGWKESAIYSFQGGGGSGQDGAFPCDGLAFDASGRLYGATLGGGVNQPGFGTVFQLTPPATQGGAWTESLLYAFSGGHDGDSPSFGPVLDSSGNVYGTNSGGGSAGFGTIFELSAGGQETTLHSISRTDGVNPSGLLRDLHGNLYGTTQAGGTGNFGTVFKLTP